MAYWWEKIDKEQQKQKLEKYDKNVGIKIFLKICILNFKNHRGITSVLAKFWKNKKKNDSPSRHLCQLEIYAILMFYSHATNHVDVIVFQKKKKILIWYNN